MAIRQYQTSNGFIAETSLNNQYQIPGNFVVKSAPAGGTPVTSAYSSGFEYASNIQVSNGVYVESSAKVQSQYLQVFENTKSVTTQTVVAQENISAILKQIVTAIENKQGLIAVTKSIKSEIENISGISAATAQSLESLAKAIISLNSVTESNKLLAISDYSAFEGIESLSSQELTTFESGQGLIAVANSISSELESLLPVISAELSQIEIQASFVSVNSAISSQVESLGPVANEIGSALESNKITMLATPVNSENLSSLKQGHSVIYETAQSFLSVTSGPVSYEVLQRIQKSGNQPYAFIKAISASRTGQYQTTATVIAAGAEAIELLKGTSNGYQVSEEALQLLINASSMEFEFLNPNFSLFYLDFEAMLNEFVDTSGELLIEYFDTSSE